MKKFLCIIAIISLSIMLFPLQASAKTAGIPDDIPYILIDSKTGRVIAEQHADQRFGPASTTKLLTAIVALENGELSREMKVSQQAVYDIGKGGMNIGIMAGEEGLTLENMLNVMLIKSANETANIIAENVASSRTEFIDMMNRKAKELGAVSTTFVNPSGKDTEKADEGHLTTPRDMAIISRHAMTLPELRKIVATEYYEGMPVTNKHDDWGILRNTNQFLWYDNTYPYTFGDKEYEYKVIGMKTGYTAQAGNNLITAAVGEDGMELIAVVMHVMQPNKIYGYSKQLMRYGFENCSMQNISKAGQTVKTVSVEGAGPDENALGLVTEADFDSALPVGTGIRDIEARVNVTGNVAAPVNKGDILGHVEYWDKDVMLGKVSIVASRSVAATPAPAAQTAAASGESEQNYSYILLIILLVLSGFILLRSTLRRISRRVKRKKYGI